MVPTRARPPLAAHNRRLGGVRGRVGVRKGNKVGLVRRAVHVDSAAAQSQKRSVAPPSIQVPK